MFGRRPSFAEYMYVVPEGCDMSPEEEMKLVLKDEPDYFTTWLESFANIQAAAEKLDEKSTEQYVSRYEQRRLVCVYHMQDAVRVPNPAYNRRSRKGDKSLAATITGLGDTYASYRCTVTETGKESHYSVRQLMSTTEAGDQDRIQVKAKKRRSAYTQCILYIY